MCYNPFNRLKSYLRTHALHHALAITLLTVLMFAIPLLLNATTDGNDIWGAPTQKNICQPNPDGSPGWCSAIAGDSHYCEHIVWERFLRTPYNGLSNMMFPICGLITLSTVSLHFRWMNNQTPTVDPQNHLQRFVAMNVLYSVNISLCGLGSFICHSAITYFSAQLDRAGIWMMLTPTVSMTLLRWVPMKVGETSKYFYYVWTFFWYILVPGGLSAFHLIDPTNPLATPLLYKGIPLIVGGCIILTFLRTFLGLTILLPSIKSNFLHAFLCISFAGIAYLFQKPENVDACDPESGRVYKLTHAYWHILIAVASFMHHRFCFFEVVGAGHYAERRSSGRRSEGFQMSRLSKGNAGVHGVTFEERNSLIVEEGGKTVSIRGVEVLL
ncbi:hypothetical protein TrST_g11135 [Triparma strigata]|uniref:Ceramidase n=1 Tax=Triparma strigata TaxID=1606541 RepID=A0A9W7C5V3_9STRA|nr:hypothetical protein TrST_g11135 [Triparma strigata]